MHGHTCKHIYAVRIVRQRELFDDGSERITETVTFSQTVERKTYPQQWPAYNRAQVAEKEIFQELLAALCLGIQEPPQATGRPRIPIADAVFALLQGVLNTSGRRFMSDLRDAHAKGHIGCVPHFNSIFQSFGKRETDADPHAVDRTEQSAPHRHRARLRGRFDRVHDQPFSPMV